MKLEVLAKHIQNAGFGTIGTNIFVHRMESDCQRGIVLKLPINGVDTDYELPGFFKSPLQAIVRNPVQQEGDAIAKQLTDALTFEKETAFFDERGELALQIKLMYPTKLPIIYPRTDGYGIEWSLNFACAYVMP